MMLKRGFIKLLKRYRDGTLPGHIREAMEVWYGTIQKAPVEKNRKEEIRARIWSGIQEGRQRDDAYKEQRGLHWKSVSRWIGAAAILLVMATVYYLSETKPALKEQVEEGIAEAGSGWMEEANNDQDKRGIALPDGSKVVLEPGSKLRYQKGFSDGERTVFLEGSGFFDVTKDPGKPFIVYSGSVLTRVLGTSFTIRALSETGGTEVAVVTGKVIVEKNRVKEKRDAVNEKENRIVLTPNKKVTFFATSDLYVTGLVENPVVVASEEAYLRPGAFNFDETPLSEVLDKLEKAYGLEITVSNDAMLECPVTADVSSESLYGKMEIIGAVLNAQYEITGSSILLAGGGCNP